MVTDDFDRADGGLGANWTTIAGDVVIDANAAKGNTAEAANAAMYSASAFAAAQYSQVFFEAPGQFGKGPMVRMAATRGYAFVPTDGARDLYRVDGASSFTLLQGFGGSGSASDILKIAANGAILQCFVNGTQIGTDQTDSTYSDGSAGLFIYSNSGIHLDDWEGGDLAAARRFFLIP